MKMTIDVIRGEVYKHGARFYHKGKKKEKKRDVLHHK